jgi:hypothetical protein
MQQRSADRRHRRRDCPAATRSGRAPGCRPGSARAEALRLVARPSWRRSVVHSRTSPSGDRAPAHNWLLLGSKSTVDGAEAAAECAWSRASRQR